MRKMPTQQELKKIFNYDYSTGFLRWNDVKPRGMRQPGRIAGTKKDNGRIQVYVNNKPFYAHRLIWKYVYGDFDESLVIDHINGNQSDNSIANLRLVNTAENSKNCRLSKNNTSGHTGVYYCKQTGRWHVSVHVNYIKKHVGVFISKEAAIFARKEAEVSFGFHPNHGRV